MAGLAWLSCSSLTEPAKTPGIDSVVVDQAGVVLAYPGRQDTLVARAYHHDSVRTAVAFTWTSSDTAIAFVDPSGVVTALGAGAATITVSASGAMGTVKVTVLGQWPDSVMCSGGRRAILLVVDPALLGLIPSSFQQYAHDLCNAGYRVWMARTVLGTPPDLRTYLREAWNRSLKTLAGVLLVGETPHAYQVVVLHSTNPQFPDVEEEVLSYQYYADVNGSFGRSPTFGGTHPFSYDVHEGAVDWEFWVGVLPVYKGSVTRTAEALNLYFGRNHAYRLGGPKPPRAFLEVSELLGSPTPDATVLSYLRAGQYAWTPFSSASTARIYFATPTVGLSLAEGYAALRAGVADFSVLDAHGWYGASGRLTIDSIESNPANTIFLWSNGCAVGNLDQPDNFLADALYAPGSTVLVAKGTTNNSGGMGTNREGFFGHNVATAMEAGLSFGDAVLHHVNVPLIWPWSDDREFYFATAVILGDPTLKLR